MAGSPQQYEATSCSVSARHPPTAQSHSLLRPQSQVHHCLLNLTTKFCQSHHPAVNSEGHLQPPFLKGSGDKQCVHRAPPRPRHPDWAERGLQPEAAPGEGARGLAQPHRSLLLPLPSLCTANRRTVLPSPIPLLSYLKQLRVCLVGLSCELGGWGGLCSVAG